MISDSNTKPEGAEPGNLKAGSRATGKQDLAKMGSSIVEPTGTEPRKKLTPAETTEIVPVIRSHLMSLFISISRG